jgi:siroheme synthase (precorrin-2 oxidase/ferrochelatase)
MSEQDLSNATSTPSTESDSPQDNSATGNNHLLAKLILEIQQTPEEYLPNLLQIVRLFRESVTLKPVRSDAYAKVMDEVKNPDPVKKAVRQIAVSELLRQWEEEGDEQEQKETWEILSKALDEGGVSI